MFGSEILDVAIGLIFVFLLLSLMCSAVKEICEAWMKKRATDLEKGIRELLLNDPNDLKAQKENALVRKLYNHPLVYGLFQGDYDPDKIKNNGNYSRMSNLPSYIPSSTFALALMDIISPATPTVPPAVVNTTPAGAAPVANPTPFQAFQDAISKIDNNHVKQALMALSNTAENDLVKLRKNIEAWYDSAMEQVAGWYKQNSQKMLLVFAFIITVGMNVDTIEIANYLYHNKALRESLVAQAEVGAKDPNWQIDNFKTIDDKIKNIRLPIGFPWWDDKDTKKNASADESKNTHLAWNTILLRIIGWCITAFAISMGAPFWFDLLNKFIKIRSAIKPDKEGANKPAGK